MHKKVFLLALLSTLPLLTACKKKGGGADNQPPHHTMSYWNDPMHKDELKKAMDFCNAEFGSKSRDGSECSVITEAFSKESWKDSLSNGPAEATQSLTQSLTKGDNVW